MTKIIEVIETEERRGLGTKNDPVRLVKQYFTKDGKLLFEEPDKWLKEADHTKGGNNKARADKK